MISMLNSAVSGSSQDLRPSIPPALPPDEPAGPGDVDVNVVLVFRVDHERVGVRTAAGLDGGDLLRLANSLMSKMRTPRKRSGLGGGGGGRVALPRHRQWRSAGGGGGGVAAAGVGNPCVPQSRRPLAASADMNSRWP